MHHCGRMSVEGIAISAFVTIFAFGLLLISLASYKRYKNLKLLFVSFVFLLFLVKGLLLSVGLIYDEFSELISNIVFTGLVDLLMLVLLFIATLRR